MGAGLAPRARTQQRQALASTPATADAGAAKPARVILNTTPPDASVYINGVLTAHRTPAVLSGLPLNQTVTIGLSLSGYAEQRYIVTLSSGQLQQYRHTFLRLHSDAGVNRTPSIGRRKRRVARRLRRRPPAQIKPIAKIGQPLADGKLTLDSTPWSTVYLDGKKVGITPIARLRVPAGEHTLRLETSDKQQRTIKIHVPASGHVKKHVQLGVGS